MNRLNILFVGGTVYFVMNKTLYNSIDINLS